LVPPVFLADGPDGALYVCDMYRKTIEHPDYLPEEVRKRTDFESGKQMGRIWRVVSTRSVRAAKPGAFRDELARISKDIKDEREVEKLADDPNPRVRFGLALALGDSTGPFAITTLAKLAAQDPRDHWMRAAVLSGIAGREASFFQAIESDSMRLISCRCFSISMEASMRACLDEHLIGLPKR
jgi:hypothetical protein